MIDFIYKLKKDFNIEIVRSLEPIQGENTFDLDEQGNIKSLFLEEVKLKNLDVLLPIAKYISELSVEDCSIENMNSLKHFDNLKKLNLSLNPMSESDFENLKFLENLKELDLRITDLKDTSPLGGLTNLEVLNVSFNHELYEVKGLDNLPFLKRLKLQFHEIDSIEKISVNKNIQFLNLRAGSLNKISGLERFPNLIELELDSNSITEIQGVNHLKELKRLNLSTAWINKIEGLDQLMNLEILDLSNQKIEKIEGLESLLKLKQLNLSENKIRKVENLDNLINLEYLLLDYNDIHEFDANFLHKLNSPSLISLVGNPIKELNIAIPENVKVQFEDSNWVPKGL